MANISKNMYGEYIVEGPLIQDDINFLNRLDRNSNVCFYNTKDLSIDALKQINNEYIKFGVIGGIDRNKRKYNNSYYLDRIYHSKEELIKILEYFNYIEKDITDDMSDIEKCMYIYCSLIQDTDYVSNFRDADVDSRLIENTLRGNLYHKLTCAGVALTFKELMDRQGIKCEYLNVQNSHSFNRIEINGKKYGIDLTWDLNHNPEPSLDTLNYFGRQDSNRFYKGYHNLQYEEDETMDELSTFTNEEIENTFNKIKPLLDRRVKHVAAVNSMTKEEKISTLGIHHNYNEMQREEMFIKLIRYLEKKDKLNKEDYRVVFSNIRYPLVGDIVGPNISSLENVHGIYDGLANNYKYDTDTLKEEHDTSVLKAINNYLDEYIKEFFNNSSIYSTSFKYVSAEEDVELNIIYEDIKKKIEYFNIIKDKVVNMGYGEELAFFNYKLKQEEDKRKQERKDKYEVRSQYDMDYDYLSSALSSEEMFYIKNAIEKSIGREITMDEFKNYFTDPNYMRKLFNKEWQFNDEELHKLLTEVYNEQINNMINLMNQQKETIKEEVPQVQPVDNNNYFSDFDFEDTEDKNYFI